MRLLILVALLFAAPALGQTNTPTHTPTNTPTPTITPTYAAPPTPVCSGARLTGQLQPAGAYLTGTTEQALIEASASDKNIVLHTLCVSTAGATVVTLTYEQPYHGISFKYDFAGAGAECFDVRGVCLPDGIDLLVKQSQSVVTQVTSTYTEQ